jgi:hypothetical protein
MLLRAGGLSEIASVEPAALFDAESRAQLAHDAFAALKDHGMSVFDGGALAARRRAGLTGVERRVSAPGIHESATPRGAVKWMRGGALAQMQGQLAIFAPPRPQRGLSRMHRPGHERAV